MQSACRGKLWPRGYVKSMPVVQANNSQTNQHCAWRTGNDYKVIPCNKSTPYKNSCPTPKHLIHFSVSIHCLRNIIPCSYQCYSPSNSTWCKYDDLMRQHVRQAMAKKGQNLKTQIAVESRHVILPLRGSLDFVFLFDRRSIHHSPPDFSSLSHHTTFGPL